MVPWGAPLDETLYFFTLHGGSLIYIAINQLAIKTTMQYH